MGWMRLVFGNQFVNIRFQVSREQSQVSTVDYFKTISLAVQKLYHRIKCTLYRKLGKAIRKSLTRSHTWGYLSLILFCSQNEWYEILNFGFSSRSLFNVMSSSSRIPFSEIILQNGSIIQSGTSNWNTSWNRTSMSAFNSWRCLLYASMSAFLYHYHCLNQVVASLRTEKTLSSKISLI